ncbi:MAG: four-carbon acid sugar kinase family protein [Actinomycetes bacterium]
MKILVIGDDLTGCNAAGALFAQAGFSVLSITGRVQGAGLASQAEVVILNTNSRTSTSEFAYKETESALAVFTVDPLISKRIDSTFRGNIGYELRAIKDSIKESHPGRIMKFIVVPAFPDAGRTTKDGIHFLHGVPISESKVNTDQHQVLETSRISEILSSQFDGTISEIDLESINATDDQLFEKLLNSQAEVIICDAENNEHIRKIAKAAARVEKTHSMHWVAVDPGPFSVALTIARSVEPSSAHPIILSFVASHTTTSSDQIEFSKGNLGATWVKVDTRTQDHGEVVKQILEIRNQGAVFIGIDLSQQNLEKVETESISQLSRLIVESLQPAAVYASGGETAAAVLRGLEAEAFTIDFEILPLAVSGRIVGGPFAEMSFATKGGLIGSVDATAICLKHLMQLSTYKRSVNQSNRKATKP